ncbi:DHH family phosphoesterase [Lichenibacterium ramalinae]|uniref:DHH family phosphoesterase n=1 Tax=Lichenibacterium ramalinae TaxID=2316527 RepID=A0A4Q2RFG2_9HYPH|nr:DHH family phosphoesterase [Lichenibacterium ramalinae]RYB05999.1 DHH family phosphoesterase [Lichenibacterium ramalinae]
MATDTGEAFRAALAGFDPGRPVAILCHNDADGLSAGALFQHALGRAGRDATLRVVGRGESAWSDEMRAEFAGRAVAGFVVGDLGTRAEAVLPGVPTIVVDHHVPRGPAEAADGVTVLSGYAEDPVPTTSLMAFRCAAALAPAEDLLWLCAVGLVGDLGDKAPFPELAAAKKLYTATAIREVVSLVNAPRRTATGDYGPALDLLLAADNPKDLLSGRHPGLEALQAAREEVKAALEAAKRVPPRIVGDIALIGLDSGCQIHPLVAQAWRQRLKDKVVLAANHGYRPGWVHFAARTALDRNLIAFLRGVAPPGADENYGGGHEQASGGALRLADWPVFLRNIGFPAA